MRGNRTHVIGKPYARRAFLLTTGAGLVGTWPQAALKTFQDIDAFCRRHVRTAPVPMDPAHVTYQAVRTGAISKPRSRSRQWQS